MERTQSNMKEDGNGTIKYERRWKGQNPIQAGAELCQAQAQFGLPDEAEIMVSSMDVPSIFSKVF
jgi:hypothetical protein